MVNRRFEDLFGQPARRPDRDLLIPFHMDVAASVQAVTEEIVLRLTRSLAAEYGIPNLCLAGGVALNCVANGKVLRDGAFRDVWRSEEHTSELQSLMRISYAVFCLKKKK